LPVAEEVGLVVEQSLDDLARESPGIAGAQHADELVDIVDPVFAEHSGKRAADTPLAAFGELLTGPFQKQVGNDPVRDLRHLHAASPA